MDDNPSTPDEPPSTSRAERCVFVMRFWRRASDGQWFAQLHDVELDEVLSFGDGERLLAHVQRRLEVSPRPLRGLK